jgi:hypothetical protein
MRTRGAGFWVSFDEAFPSSAPVGEKMSRSCLGAAARWAPGLSCPTQSRFQIQHHGDRQLSGLCQPAARTGSALTWFVDAKEMRGSGRRSDTATSSCGRVCRVCAVREGLFVQAYCVGAGPVPIRAIEIRETALRVGRAASRQPCWLGVGEMSGSHDSIPRARPDGQQRPMPVKVPPPYPGRGSTLINSARRIPPPPCCHGPFQHPLALVCFSRRR